MSGKRQVIEKDRHLQDEEVDRNRTGKGQRVKEDDGSSNTKRRGRQNPSRKKNNDNRAQDMREKKGQQYQEEYNQKIKEKWLSGIETAEKLEERLKEVANQKAQMLSVTTRGVGVNLLSSMFTTTAYKNDIPIPNLYELYRVCMAVTEAKVQSLRTNYPIPPRFTDKAANLINSAEFNRICRSVIFLPKPISNIINTIGIVKIGNTIHIPAFSADYIDTRGRFIPSPEIVRFGNLRQTVEALADDNTPRAYREAFHRRNCVPGAIWSENHMLMNADEIMPANYTNDDLARDSIRITPWMSNLQKHVPKLVGSTISFENTGRKSLLVCNGVESLKLPDRTPGESVEAYIMRGIPEGNIKTFHSPYEITTAERLEGQLSLLGERPVYGNFKDPLFTHRLEARCEFEYTSDYLSSLQMSFGY